MWIEDAHQSLSFLLELFPRCAYDCGIEGELTLSDDGVKQCLAYLPGSCVCHQVNRMSAPPAEAVLHQHVVLIVEEQVVSEIL